jgi:hypothetical protein
MTESCFNGSARPRSKKALRPSGGWMTENVAPKTYSSPFRVNTLKRKDEGDKDQSARVKDFRRELNANSRLGMPAPTLPILPSPLRQSSQMQQRDRPVQYFMSGVYNASVRNDFRKIMNFPSSKIFVVQTTTILDPRQLLAKTFHIKANTIKGRHKLLSNPFSPGRISRRLQLALTRRSGTLSRHSVLHSISTGANNPVLDGRK